MEFFFNKRRIFKAETMHEFPIYVFAICNNTFSKWWEGLRMSCRRVLSSTPLLVKGSETGGDSGERKLTNNNYN
jgi:hypothetical protein